MLNDFQARLNKSYIRYKYLYSELSSVENFIAINNPTSDDVNALRVALYNLRDSYKDGSIAFYNAIDQLNEVIELYDVNILNTTVLNHYATINEVSDTYMRLDDVNEALVNYSRSSDLYINYTTVNDFNDVLGSYVTKSELVALSSHYAKSSFVGASNIADGTIADTIGDTAIKMGTLRSFYRCSNGGAGSSKSLITTGYDTLSGRLKNIMDCINYVTPTFLSNSDFFNAELSSDGESIAPNSSPIFFSNFDTGACYSNSNVGFVGKIGSLFVYCMYGIDH